MRCPYLVGRELQLATLHARLAAARDGSGAMVFVSGEPGVGKSRLVQELAERARADHALVLAGRAVSTSGEVRYRPIAEALAQAVRDRNQLDEAALSGWLPALRVMLPPLGPGPAPAPGGAGPATAHTCGEALIRMLRWARGGGPLVLVLEDLHWADPDSLDVVEYLADNLTREPVLVVGTLRDQPSGPALELVRRLRQRGAATDLRLGRLTADQVTELVIGCDPDADHDRMARVQAAAEGVPLLVEELLAAPGTPGAVREPIRTLVGALSLEVRSVLYAAAVLGHQFSWEVLPVITGAPADRVTAALEQLVSKNLLEVTGDGFRFCRVLTREAVLALLVPPRRAALARAALAALDGAEPDHGRAELALLAGEPARAGALLAASGHAALRAGRLGAAVGALHRAAGLLERPAERTAAQAALLESLALAGRLDEARATGTDLQASLHPGDPRLVAVQLELARAAANATAWPAAAAHLAAAKELLTSATTGTGRAAAQIAVLAAELASVGDTPAAAGPLARDALAAAESAGGPELNCHARELIGRSYHRANDLTGARDWFTQAHQAADLAGLPVWRLRARHQLGTLELLDQASTEPLLAVRRSTEQLGAHSVAVVVDIQLAVGYQLRFELDSAYRHARRAVALTRRFGPQRRHAVARFLVAATSALRGDRAAVAEAVAEARRAAPDDVEIDGKLSIGVFGLLDLFWGDRQGAVEAFDRGMAMLPTTARAAPGYCYGLWALLQAVERRAGAAGWIAQVRESGVIIARVNQGYLHYADAVLERSVDRVVAGDRDLGYFPVWMHLGRTLVAEAALVEGWGTPRRWLREAKAGFDARGLARLSEHCIQLLGASPQDDPTGLTTREAEVFKLVSEGLSNKQIAARLHLSPRTVEKHISSLLRKTGTRSRTHLVAI